MEARLPMSCQRRSAALIGAYESGRSSGLGETPAETATGACIKLGMALFIGVHDDISGNQVRVTYYDLVRITGIDPRADESHVAGRRPSLSDAAIWLSGFIIGSRPRPCSS
jgi:hypothetical protein